MIPFHTTLLFALAAFEFLLMLYILRQYERRGSIYALAGLLFGFVVIAVFAGLQLFTSDDTLRLLFGKLAFYGGCISFVSNLLLAIEYPVPSRVSSKWKTILSVGPLAFFLPYILFAPNFIDHIVRINSALNVFPGSSFWVFTLFVLGYYFATSILLVQKQKSVIGTQKKQARLFAIVYILTAALGILDTFLLPLKGIPSNAVFGADVDAVVVTLIAFIVLRKA